MKAGLVLVAIALVAASAQQWLGQAFSMGDEAALALRAFTLAAAAALVGCVPAFRQACAAALTRLRGANALEAGVVAALNVCVPFAVAGATVLAWWTLSGEMGLARRLGELRTVDAASISFAVLVVSFVVSALIAPVVEELVFRGILYRALEQRCGWIPAMLATSAMCALCHPSPFAGFVGSMILIAVLRRTGSLWAPILVRTVGEIALWPLALGRFYFVTAGKETGEIELWSAHLAAAALLVVALPVYLWMSRDPPLLEADLVEEAA